MNNLIKIAIVGPESTGKSTVAQYLAEEFDTVTVPEYARYYCQNLNNQYTPQDEVNMFYGQIALEDALVPMSRNNLLFCDTTILTVKIWSDHLFADTPNEIKEEINKRHYDLYLLMNIDLPWQDDPLRDFPKDRDHFLQIWKNELHSLKANYKLISGTDEQRIHNAKDAVLEFLSVEKDKAL